MKWSGMACNSHHIKVNQIYFIELTILRKISLGIVTGKSQERSVDDAGQGKTN